MATGYTFLQSIFTAVDSATASYISSTVSDVVTAFTPVAKQCFTLYVILWGFAHYRGMVQEPILDGMFRLMKIALILAVAINVGQYNSLVANNLLALPDFFTSLFGASGTTASAKATLDTILSDMVNIGTEFWEQGSLVSLDPNPGAYFMALLVWISALVTTGYAAFLMILSKVALTVLVGIGPMFILGLMFEGTKKFFEAWLGQALNFCFISGLAVGVIKLLFTIYANAATGTLSASGAADFGFVSCATLLVLSVICFLVLMQVMSIASGIAGGVAVSTLGAVAAAMSRGQSALSGMRPSNMQRAYRKVQRDVRATRSAGASIGRGAVWAARKITGNDRNSIRQAA